jgi:dipeptidyl-peptidase 4
VGVNRDTAADLANATDLRFNAKETGILVNYNNDLWYFDTSSKMLRRLTNNREEEKEADFSPDGRWVSFVRGNNLFVVEALRGGEKQLTRDGREGEKAIFNGYLDWVYEEELYGRGNKRGYWWSPDSRRIAFLRLDEANVPKFIIPNDIVDDQIVETTDYPQAGDPNPDVKLGIADVGATPFVPNIARIPTIGNRLPSAVRRVGDAVTDLNCRVRKLLTETTPAWVEVYDNPVFIDSGGFNGTFVWQSARNGWPHLYLYDNAGKQIRTLTSGKWEVRNFYGVDEQGGWAYFSGTKDSHIAENIYRVSLGGGEVQRVSRGDGWHSASFNDDFTRYVGTWSDIFTPPQARLHNADGSVIRVINENRVEALSRYRRSRPEFLNVRTRDGFEMEAMMIKPPDFDPSKKYPVFQFTYAGPHAFSVANRWGGSRGMWFQMLAQKGYIVWVLDNRTASGKGQESVWPSYKRFMVLELRDLEDGVNYLKSLPYVDSTRIGLHGWSFGGMMTSYALTHSNMWKMGIAGGSVTDWRLYDSIYTERYMLMPQNNPQGYDETSVIKAAKNLSGKLLLIHGAIDDNVHMQNTLQLAYALQEADKQFDLMIYPTQRHGITNPAQVKHWYTMMTEYIMRNL